MFISFEGQDGSGKSSLIKKIEKFLKKNKIKFVSTREPGNPHSKESKQIRNILIKKENNLPPITEALLFAADRRLHLDEVILPSLKANKIVLCDRYVDSSLAYQGSGRQIGIEKVKAINEIATKGKYPDLTFFLKVSRANALKRMKKRQLKDRIEVAKNGFQQRVFKGYKEIAKMFPQRFKIIDANQSREKVYEDTIKIIKKLLNI